MNILEAPVALDCSRSGYHSHLRKPRRKRRSQNAALGSQISSTFLAARGVYGCHRIMHSLRAQGLRLGKNRISKLMRTNGLRVQQKRRFIPRTTIADKASPVAPYHLLSRPPAERLNQVWFTDICFASLTRFAGSLRLAVSLRSPPISRPPKVGSTSPLRWTLLAAASSAGALWIHSIPHSPPLPSSAPFKLAPTLLLETFSTTATVVANTPAPTFAVVSNSAPSPKV